MNEILYPPQFGGCLFCSPNQWMPAGVRFLNAAVNYNPFAVSINNRTVSGSLDQGEITRYAQVNPGYQTVTLTSANGYIYLQKPVYIGDGMTTLAIVNAPSGLDVTAISDEACSTNPYSACIRVANLAYYSGDINARVGNIIFSSVAFGDAASFSRVAAGTYSATITRNQNPRNTLLTVPLTLSANRIYTLYVMNWNPSADAVQTLLVEDRRS